MAKKKKAAVAKRTASKSRQSTRKWHILFFLPVLLIAVFVVAYNPRSASVLGVSTVAFRSATVRWPAIPNAVQYNIYYKAQSDSRYTNAVTNIPSGTTAYTINYLKKNTKYQYMISAVDGSGKEFWFSSQKWM